MKEGGREKARGSLRGEVNERGELGGDMTHVLLGEKQVSVKGTNVLRNACPFMCLSLWRFRGGVGCVWRGVSGDVEVCVERC